MSDSARDPVSALRAELAALLDRLTPGEAARCADFGLQDLLMVVRQYGTIPPSLAALLKRFTEWESDAAVRPAPEGLGEAVQMIRGLPEAWGFASYPAVAPTAAEPGQVLDDGDPVCVPKLARDGPTELPWPELVQAVRKHLEDERPLPGASYTWTLPQRRWRARWAEGYEALSPDGLRRAMVVVPDAAAGADDEARLWWEQRVRAGRLLRNHGRLDSCVAQVLDCAPGFVVLARENVVPPPLEKRLASGVRLSPREAFQVGRALCDTLRYSNGLGVHVLDLAPDWIAWECKPALRIMQLMDPTAVIPAVGLLPEYRGLPARIAIEQGRPEPAQVFLVGALVLGLIFGTTGLLREGRFPPGPSAVFAALSGQAGLAGGPPERIAGPLVADLEDRLRARRHDLPVGAAVGVLRLCLADTVSERYPSLAELAAAVNRVLGPNG